MILKKYLFAYNIDFCGYLRYRPRNLACQQKRGSKGGYISMCKGSINVQWFYQCTRVLSMCKGSIHVQGFYLSLSSIALRTISFSDPQLFFCTMPFDDNMIFHNFWCKLRDKNARVFQMDDDPSCVDPGSVSW